ncbi:MAG: hypothetical protein PF961_22140 [Planctomycetota bacterium]|nr:hypothetical protein [Planctomycetota bacterium]
MRILVITALMISSVHSEESVLPSSIQSAKAEYVANCEGLDQKYRESVRKEREKYIAVLEREVSRQTKKGNLDLALAVKAEKESIEGQFTLDILGDRILPIQSIVGKWKLNGTDQIREFMKDGAAPSNGTWSQNPDGTVRWSTKSNTHILTFDHTSQAWVCVRDDGYKVTLQAIEQK